MAVITTAICKKKPPYFTYFFVVLLQQSSISQVDGGTCSWVKGGGLVGIQSQLEYKRAEEDECRGMKVVQCLGEDLECERQ